MKNDRTFRLWGFSVSHAQLLLRSPKDQNFSKNVDILFVGVEYVELPVSIVRARIEDADDAEHRRLRQWVRHAESRIFVIASEEHRHFIVAAGMRTEENELGFDESSIEFPIVRR